MCAVLLPWPSSPGDLPSCEAGHFKHVLPIDQGHVLSALERVCQGSRLESAGAGDPGLLTGCPRERPRLVCWPLEMPQADRLLAPPACRDHVPGTPGALQPSR